MAGGSTVPDPDRPRRREDARAFPLGDEVLIYVPGDHTAHALNRSATVIWGLCDGSRTVEAISAEIGQGLGRGPDELLADVRLGVAQLSALGLVEAG